MLTLFSRKTVTLQKISTATLLALVGLIVIGNNNSKLRSANLTSVSDTISNARPSFRGALTTGNTVGSSVVLINTTTGSYPSTSSAQLVEGDVVRIGENGSLGSYTVASTSSLSTFYITSTLASGDNDSGDDVIATSSASHTIRFTTANAIANGRFRILVPALADNGASADGIPDSGAFDFGTSAPTVTCPANATATYDFVTGAATASAITIGSTDYHVYECAYSGTGAVGTAFNGSTNDAITLSSIINPAPRSTHSTGLADTYNIVVQHLDSTLNVVDTTSVAVGVIEAVKVTASVDPQITFQIIGQPTGTSACGVSSGVTTTAASVPFGPISISAFTNAVHGLTVSTNAANGFAVTAVENDQLGRNGGACAGDPTITSNTNCIADARGDNGTMTDSTSADWAVATNRGFGYSLHDVNASTTEAFAYNESARTFSARQFADTENSDTPVTLFSSTGPADNQNLYVCYRIVAGTTTAAGNYENYLTYTATATF